MSYEQRLTTHNSWQLFSHSFHVSLFTGCNRRWWQDAGWQRKKAKDWRMFNVRCEGIFFLNFVHFSTPLPRFRPRLDRWQNWESLIQRISKPWNAVVCSWKDCCSFSPGFRVDSWRTLYASGAEDMRGSGSGNSGAHSNVFKIKILRILDDAIIYPMVATATKKKHSTENGEIAVKK